MKSWKDRSIQKEIGCEPYFTYGAHGRKKIGHPSPQLASENCLMGPKQVRGVSRVRMAENWRQQEEVPQFLGIFSINLELSSQEYLGKSETRENFLPRVGSQGEGSCSLCSEQKELSNHQIISIMEQKPEATGEGTTIPVFPEKSSYS